MERPAPHPPEHEQVHMADVPAEPERERAPLEFTPEEKRIIESRRRVLASTARFIGKDFDIPVETGEPGSGWAWNFVENKIKCDPVDILEKDPGFLRFVIGHEASHRRISRADHLGMAERARPGFMFLWNALEDPRVNNFLVNSYPVLREDTETAYKQDMDFERKADERAEAKMGFRPRHQQAGFELIREWFFDARELPLEIDDSLPPEVQDFIRTVQTKAQDFWWTYPSKGEADLGEEEIMKYARQSLEVLERDIYPEYKKLVDADIGDAMVEQVLQEQAVKRGEELWDSLSDEQKRELEQQIEEALDRATDPDNPQKPDADGEPNIVIPLDKISDGLKQKIIDYLESKDVGERYIRRGKAERDLSDLDDAVNDDLGGKMTDITPTDGKIWTPVQAADDGEPSDAEDAVDADESTPAAGVGGGEVRSKLQEMLERDRSVYEQYREELLPLINQLETELSRIFTVRAQQGWEGGYRQGKRIDIGKRMGEKARGVSAVESHSWEQRKLPTEKDYAFELLVDLSSSMYGGSADEPDTSKLQETFKAVIVMSEVLSRLSIPFDITGFNNDITRFKEYGEKLDSEMQNRISTMLAIAQGGTQDATAIHDASKRLAERSEQEKFLIVLTDGVSGQQTRDAYGNLDGKVIHEEINHVLQDTDQKLIAIGLLTDAVRQYYPRAIVENNIKAFAKVLAKVLEDAISEADER